MKRLFYRTMMISQRFFIAIFILSLCFSSQLLVYCYGLDIPSVDPAVENKVPFETVKKVAELKAEVLWGKVVSGPIIPFSDINGKLTAYLFMFYTDDGQFPSIQEINKKITETTSKSFQLQHAEENWQQDFGYIVLSATYDQVPIIEYAHHVPQYYLSYEKAKARASLKLGAIHPRLIHIYYGGPLEQWFEFAEGGKTILIDAFTMKPYVKKQLVKVKNHDDTIKNDIKERVEEAWVALEKFEPSVGYCVRDSNVIDSVPFYTWSYGCTPTASAMLMGYWDERNYGRLVDYYFDHPDVPTQQTIYNVPNVQRELAIEMGTDTIHGGTWGDSVPGGHLRVANDINGYSFNSTFTYGGDWNDWCWDLIKSEIDAGRPFHWMVNDYLRIGPHHGEIDTMYPVNHSITATGYVDNGALENDFVIVHDTWNAYVTYWALYTTYGGYSYSSVATLVPGGAESNNIRLTFPTGGEVLENDSTYEITWTSTGAGIDHCALYYSSDNCEYWETIEDIIPNTGSHSWIAPTGNMENVRVKIDAYNSSRDLLADDASRDNFQVTSGNASGIDTIAYENCSPYYIDALPITFNGFPLDYYNVRFTPIDDCSLLAAQFYFARKGGTGWTLRVYVWSDSGGFPYEIIDSVDVPEDSINTSHDETGWTSAYLAEKNITFLQFQDFHIGYSLIGAGAEDSLPLIADYGFTDRSSAYWNGNFVTVHSLTGGGHNYFIDAIVSYDYEGCEEGKQPAVTPVVFSIDQNYPNPFKQSTTINYQLSAATKVTLTVYDVTGRKVTTLFNEYQKAGNHRYVWNGTDKHGRKLASGIYFSVLEVNGNQKRKKILLLK
jgi:hypothetical protein